MQAGVEATRGSGCPHLLPPARGRLSHRSWGRRLLMTSVLPLRREERLRAGRLHRLWRIQGWRLPRGLLKREELPLGTWGRQPPQQLLASITSVQYLVGLRTWSGTSLKLTWRQEVQEHLACRYLNLHLQARGCHGGQLTGITPLGRRTGLKITRTYRPCGPASLPSIPR
jgi:hypothetical protein